MNDTTRNSTTSSSVSRRDFIKASSVAAIGGSVLGSLSAVPNVFAAENNTIQIALIGCGGRGTGAAANALSTKNGPVKLVAMADLFERKLKSSYENLSSHFADKMDVPAERRFVGLDSYKKAMDCLKPGDIIISATPPAFRWVHFQCAIEKGLNAFMEKPVTVDGPTSRRMFQLGEEAKKKNLKVAIGLMCRHCRARYSLVDQIKSGKIGEIVALRAYRMHGPVGKCFSVARQADPNYAKLTELEYQIERFHSFIWASGGLYSDFYIHNIDECCWMKNAWPVKAEALGGRHYRENNVDQNFDTYSVEYTFEDGTKFFLNGRTMNGCKDQFASYAHGAKGLAIISSAGHSPTRARIFKGHKVTKSDLVWSASQPEGDPYQLEWDDFMDAIRNNKPYSELERGVKASLVTSMGRMAAHTGQEISYEDILNSDHEMAPNLDKLMSVNDAAPLIASAEGKYPIPQPGIVTKREY